MSKGKLFEYAVLYHPKRTKEQQDLGTYPKSEILVKPTVVLGSEAEIPMVAARAIPNSHQDRLEDIEIVVRPF